MNTQDKRDTVCMKRVQRNHGCIQGLCTSLVQHLDNNHRISNIILLQMLFSLNYTANIENNKMLDNKDENINKDKSRG